MADFDKIGREVRAIFTAFPVEPETEEGRMVADLRYPGWRESRVVNVNTDDSQSSEVARALGYSGEMSVFTWSGLKELVPPLSPDISVPLLFPPEHPMIAEVDLGSGDGRTFRLTSESGEPPPLVPTPEAVEKWGRLWWAEGRDEAPWVCLVTVNHYGKLEYEFPGNEETWTIEEGGPWLGPVLERPVKP